MPTESISPNLFQLSAHHLHVSYALSGPGGKPTLTYQDATQSLSFLGADQIAVTTSDLGTLVTVYLRRTVDTGSTTFTLLVPTVSLPQGTTSAPVHTQGIVAVHRRSPIPALNSGQLETYSVHALGGTASFVVF
jgi:hypothetical protein